MISIFDLFSIGVGPSSSHTVGPMRAANTFIKEHLVEKHLIDKVESLEVSIHGSLAFTGIGHGTDRAILMGLEGQLPESIDPNFLMTQFDEIKKSKRLNLFAQKTIPFDFDQQFIFDKTSFYPNTLTACILPLMIKKEVSLSKKIITR